jgi:hypothetical protein
VLLLVDIDDIWDEMAGHMRQTLDGADFTAEDLARECRLGKALCFYASGQGMVIVKLHPNRRHNDLELVVWLAISLGPHGAIERYLPEIDEIARRVKAKRVVFSSYRTGFLRRMPEGWRLREMTIEREVPHGQ